MKLKITKKHIKFLTILLAATAVSFAVVSVSQAQQSAPQFLVTWRALSYAPPDYVGKIFPSAGSGITVSFELVNGGKLADLSKQTIYWYLNDDLISNRAGAQTVTFVPLPDATTASVRIQLPSYGTAGLIFTIVDIPIVSPAAVIVAPYPSSQFGGTAVSLAAVPYFFNVSSPSALNFAWSVNGQTPANLENPSELTINVSPNAQSGYVLGVGLTIQNPKRTSEAAAGNKSLTLIK